MNGYSSGLENETDGRKSECGYGAKDSKNSPHLVYLRAFAGRAQGDVSGTNDWSERTKRTMGRR